MNNSDCDTSITICSELESVHLYEVDLVIPPHTPQDKSHLPRKLTKPEAEKLAKDTQLVSEFKNKRLEIDAKKHWDLFYRRNSTKFFKDRYWTFREFQEIKGEEKTLLEIGCGVGNFMYPVLKENKKIFVYTCDFSTDAIQLLKSNVEYGNMSNLYNYLYILHIYTYCILHNCEFIHIARVLSFKKSKKVNHLIFNK